MSDRPDWSEWILQKNAEAKEEELKKSSYAAPHEEELEKGVDREKLPFENGSVIRLKGAIENRGYTVHETKKDGTEKLHDFIPYSMLDNAMDEGRLRMKDERSTKKHALYHAATVRHSEQHWRGSDGNMRKRKITTLTPHGEYHTPKRS